MKLNPDCIRDILVSVEEMDYNSVYTIQKLHEKIPTYSIEQLNYHCLQMMDAGLINAKSMEAVRFHRYGEFLISPIQGISFLQKFVLIPSGTEQRILPKVLALNPSAL